ncbi:Hypothetical_protein [Hexamita inflata]|uniref:Hypothetical_protein n=1 Tax=Hexamita inflata TaxID=28002 RepID=A0ABP1GWI3_9EUKA
MIQLTKLDLSQRNKLSDIGLGQISLEDLDLATNKVVDPSPTSKTQLILVRSHSVIIESLIYQKLSIISWLGNTSFQPVTRWMTFSLQYLPDLTPLCILQGSRIKICSHYSIQPTCRT